MPTKHWAWVNAFGWDFTFGEHLKAIEANSIAQGMGRFLPADQHWQGRKLSGSGRE